MIPHGNQGINDKHRTIDKILLKDIKELTRYPRICWNKIRKKTRSRTLHILTLGVLVAITVGAVERLSSAFGGLVGLGK